MWAAGCNRPNWRSPVAASCLHALDATPAVECRHMQICNKVDLHLQKWVSTCLGQTLSLPRRLPVLGNVCVVDIIAGLRHVADAAKTGCVTDVLYGSSWGAIWSDCYPAKCTTFGKTRVEPLILPCVRYTTAMASVAKLMADDPGIHSLQKPEVLSFTTSYLCVLSYWLSGKFKLLINDRNRVGFLCSEALCNFFPQHFSFFTDHKVGEGRTRITGKYSIRDVVNFFWNSRFLW